MPQPTDVEIAGRLLLALLLGGMVGLERELSDHPAGLRTHMSVALGAALFMIVGSYGFDEFARARADTNVNISVDRVASTIVSGVGFLGGGAILKYGATVKGLTTAASLWVTAAIGMGCALGSYFATLVATVALLFSLVGLKKPAAWLNRRFAPSREAVLVTLADGARVGDVVQALSEVAGVELTSLRIQEREGTCFVAADVAAKPGSDLEALLAPIASRDDVVSLDVS